MAHAYFHCLAPIDFDALAAFVGSRFGAPRELVCVYDNVRDIEALFEDQPAGRLWRAYEKSAAAVQIGRTEPGSGPVWGWFSVEGRVVGEFEERPFAHAAAAALKMTILFFDPVPDPRDSPVAMAAQIAVTPEGVERKVWLSEFGQNGRSMNLVENRD